MALMIKWSKEAEDTYRQILDYLEANWTKREIINFINRTDQVLNIISIQPFAFKASSHKKIRKAVIGKQNSLFYQIRGSQIILIRFWDNRQDPSKNKY